MDQAAVSIFRRYFTDEPFIDRFSTRPEDAVDVLIPLMHTNELWRSNLLSIYREIPVKRLLIGDGGCIDDSVEVARTFPRVVVFDHSGFVSLGYSIRKLIEAVETEWFIYLHSDVYLPEGWFDTMSQHRSEFDWFESSQHTTVLVDYPHQYGKNRPYSGSQMGRKAAFESVLPLIEDDYLYRNEDIILAGMVEQAGFRYGRLDSTFSYHQVMEKQSRWLRRIKAVSFRVEKGRGEEVRACMMQVRGIIKYMAPTAALCRGVQANVDRLLELGELDWAEFRQWIARTNPAWLPHVLPHVRRRPPFKERVRALLSASYRLFFPRT